MSKRPSFLSRLFGRPEGSPQETSADAKVRAVLEEHGDQATTPRPTTFYFYGGDYQGLAKDASAEGYITRPTAKNDGVILEKVVAVDEGAFEAIEAQMEAWGETFGCEFDGWETQVVTN
ncbi:MAG: ribonuclease E inhibitor RraB [Caulobacter sp.]|nr:ribonuclease E inhibitor RraB [Caulobacter sp.]